MQRRARKRRVPTKLNRAELERLDEMLEAIAGPMDAEPLREKIPGAARTNWKLVAFWPRMTRCGRPIRDAATCG